MSAPATADELRRLSVGEVRQWLITTVGLKSIHANKVAQQEINGAQLLKVTKNELLRISVPMGPAGMIVDAVSSLAAASASAGAGSAGRAVMPPWPLLPPPVEFVEQDMGGEAVMVTTLPYRGDMALSGPGDPFFLTPPQLGVLRRFVDRPPTKFPQMLLLTGTIKSGKSSVLDTIIPGLLAARVAAGSRSRRPVIFLHTIRQGDDANKAALALVAGVLDFALSVGATLSKPTSAMAGLPTLLLQLALHVEAGGGELWFLVDELQAPFVASTPEGASDFVKMFKHIVLLCSPCARIVGTGSGMVTLLAAVRDLQPNGFALWDAAEPVILGREPSPPVALAMAERILGAYASSRRWPREFAALLTPQNACDMLAHDADATRGLTSPRPALVAYLADVAGNGQRSGASPPIALAAAKDALLLKLDEEARADMYTALVRMQPSLRGWLRQLADPVADLNGAAPRFSKAVRAFAERLSEELPVSATNLRPRLLPPYSLLLQELVTPDGILSVTYSEGRLSFAPEVRLILKFIFEHAKNRSTARISPHARRAISSRVLESLARNGVGFTECIGAAVRPPKSLDEVRRVPAFNETLRTLDKLAALETGQLSPASSKIIKAASASDDDYLAELGLYVLSWLRHVDAHAYFHTRITERGGLTTAIAAVAVLAAKAALLEAQPETFDLNFEGELVTVELPADGKATG